MIKHCTKCGSKMIQKKMHANLFCIPNPLKLLKCNVKYPKFSEENGGRLFFNGFRCSKKRWYNDHDSYTLEEDPHTL